MQAAAVAECFVPNFDRCVPYGSGKVNETYLIESDKHGRYILQRMSDIYEPALQSDIQAIVPSLLKAGVRVPIFVPTVDGDYYQYDEAGRWWRCQEYIHGTVKNQLANDEEACSMARLIGRMHAALVDHPHEFGFVVPHFQEAEHYAERLADVWPSATTSQQHDLEPLCMERERLLERLDLSRFAALPPRIIHSDTKVSNVVFVDGEAVALIDLDMFGRRPITTDIGDMVRSSSVVAGGTAFSPDRADTVLASYLTSAPKLTADEYALLPQMCTYIALNLATRYLTDAIEGTYFNWLREEYPSHYVQCRESARKNLSLAAAAHAWADTTDVARR